MQSEKYCKLENTVVIVVIVSSPIRIDLVFFHFSQKRLLFLFLSSSIIHILYCYCYIGAAIFGSFLWL